MKEYLNAQNKTNEIIVGNAVNSDELNRFSKSDFRWADNRKRAFPTSKSDLFLLKSNEFSFISHDSVLKLNDIRTVSINRILYQQSGRIDPTSDTYKQIESLSLRKYFPSFFHELEQNNKTIKSLNSHR